MIANETYRTFQGMDYADIPADILERDSNPMFA